MLSSAMLLGLNVARWRAVSDVADETGTPFTAFSRGWPLRHQWWHEYWYLDILNGAICVAMLAGITVVCEWFIRRKERESRPAGRN
jgi:hypothetical protein